MLMALPRDEEGRVCVWQAAAALVILSTAPVAERLLALFDLSREDDWAETASGSVPAERLAPLLAALMATGQVPERRQVQVVDEGKNALGIGRDWYTIQGVREHTADELLRHAMAAARAGPPPDKGGWWARLTRPTPPPPEPDARFDAGRALEAAEFIQLMQSDAVCVWTECEKIAERRRKEAARKEAEEEAANPPPWTRLWNFLTGKGGEESR
jgi:hypothetical protein